MKFIAVPYRYYIVLLLFIYPLLQPYKINAQIHSIDWADENTHKTRISDTVYLELKNALESAIKQGNLDLQGTIYGQMGEFCFHIGQYPKALDYYLKASNVYQKAKNENQLAYTYIDLGILYYYNRDIDKSNALLYDALALFNKQKDQKGLALTYANIGFSFEKQEKYDSAYHYQIQALEVYRKQADTTNLAKIYENLGSIHEDLAHYDSAMYYFRLSLERYQARNEPSQHIEVINNIGDILRKTGKYRQSIAYTNEAIGISLAQNNIYQLSSGYRDLAKAYNLLGINDSAYYCLELSRKYALDIYSAESSRQMAFLETENNARKKDESIYQLQQSQQLNKILAIASGIIALLIAVLLALAWNRHKLKIRNERALSKQQQVIMETNNQLMEADLKSRILEEERLRARLNHEQLEKASLDAQLKANILEETLLKEQIEQKSKELSTNALHVIQKNQLLEQLKEQIEAIVHDDKRDHKKQLKQLLTSINQNFNNESYWVEFKNTFEQIHKSFYEKLTTICPDISTSELRLVSLLKMNMNANDIATLLGISSDSLRVARYRLRKKLNLEQGANLSVFLQGL